MLVHHRTRRRTPHVLTVLALTMVLAVMAAGSAFAAPAATSAQVVAAPAATFSVVTQDSGISSLSTVMKALASDTPSRKQGMDAPSKLIGTFYSIYKNKRYGKATVWLSFDEKWLCGYHTGTRVNTHTRLFRYISVSVKKRSGGSAIVALRGPPKTGIKFSTGSYVKDFGARRLAVEGCLLFHHDRIYTFYAITALNKKNSGAAASGVGFATS